MSSKEGAEVSDFVDLKNLVEQMVRSMVRRPDQVVVKAILGERSALIEVRVAPEDAGVLIGKHGRTIRAIRHVAHVIGARRGQRVQVVALNGSGDERRER